MQYDPSSKAFQKVWAKIVARAWTEPAFKKRLKAHPAEVLGEYGVEVPEGTDLPILDQSEEAASGPEPTAPQAEAAPHSAHFNHAADPHEPECGAPQPDSTCGASFASNGCYSSTHGAAAQNLGVSTVGSAGSVGCVGSVTGTVGTAASVGTAGSKGEAPSGFTVASAASLGTAATLSIPQAPGVGSRSLGGQPVSGGVTLGTGGSIGSLGTICGATAGTFGSAASLGTAGAAPSSFSGSPTALGCAGNTFAGGATLGSFGSVGSVATVTGTVGTLGCVGTAGSIGD